MEKIVKLLTLSEKDKAVIRKLDFKAPSTWLATWFGCGFMRPAPGTWGSLGALPIALLIILLGSANHFAIAILASITIGLWASARFEQMTGEHDSKMIVIDEVAGQWIALWPVLTAATINPVMIVLAFLLFRLFDILKPWPACYFDKKVKNAVGVMGDDIVAGLMAAIILWSIQYAGFS